jgi:spermidine synthase
MSGGASVRQHQQYSPETFIDAVEIDPKIIKIAKENFGVTENERLKIFQADARPFLLSSEKKYDMIEIDLFQGSPYIPFYVLTREFFDLTYDHLTDKGIIMMNIYAPANHELLTPSLETISSSFPSVFQVPIQGNNTVVLASKEFLSEEIIKERLSQTQDTFSPELTPAKNYLINFLEKYNTSGKALIFTDDWAPVEIITYKMLKGVPQLN